jgi:hypothetical protein
VTPPPSLRILLQALIAWISMGRLDHAITALNVLGSVVQAIPVIGDGMKSATEMAMRICEVIQVRCHLLLLLLR